VYSFGDAQANNRTADLQVQLDSATGQLAKASTMEERYLSLWHSVVDLWNKWSQVRCPCSSSGLALC
jgi:hypothetical protein